LAVYISAVKKMMLYLPSQINHSQLIVITHTKYIKL